MKHIKLMRVKDKKGYLYNEINEVEETDEGELRLKQEDDTTIISPKNIEAIELYEARV